MGDNVHEPSRDTGTSNSESGPSEERTPAITFSKPRTGICRAAIHQTLTENSYIYLSEYNGSWYYSPENQTMLKALYEMEQHDAESN